MKSRWRAAAFLVVLCVSAGLGLFWHESASGFGPVNPAELHPDLRIGVYTQQPDVPIRIETELRASSGKNVLTVFVNAPKDAEVLLLSSRQDAAFPDQARTLFRPLSTATNDNADYHFYLQAGSSLEPPIEDERGYAVASFQMPDDSFTSSDHRITARMPFVAEFQDATHYQPGAATTNDGTIALDPTLTDPAKISSRSVDDYKVGASAVTSLYWNPQHLTTVQTLLGIGERLPGWDIIDTPTTGVSESGDYVWTGSYGMSAVLSATDRGLEEQRSNYEFLSGIALASGFAALVALIQEGKDVWPGWRRRRLRPATPLALRQRVQPNTDDGRTTLRLAKRWKN
jgi:hypothetical protein